MAPLDSWALRLIPAITLLIARTQARIESPSDILTNLGPYLSPDANIYLPDAPQFAAATQRWSPYGTPNFTVVVEVAVEEDVVNTVQYANENDIPFLAVNGGHGTISTLSTLQHGLEIWLHRLDSVTISEDGQSATFGGGIKSGNVTQALWEIGKQTVHGVCDCTGYLGPALGGGHGSLQGNYGLISDQFVSMRLVTADGSLLTVSPDGPTSDLWWAMQGAGHNFGIVTSITSKIYDVPYDGMWAWEYLIFTHDQLEDLFALFDQLSAIQPPGFMIWTVISRNPEVDMENPVIQVNFLREGVPTIEDEYLRPFRELCYQVADKATGLFTDIPKWIETGFDTQSCRFGGPSKVRYPISFPKYNIEAQRAMFDAFAEGTAGSSPYNHSMILVEQYSVQGVQAIPEYSTAFPHRQDNLLLSPVLVYTPSAGLDAGAKEFGDSLRQILLEGTDSDELHAYVNYASGDEGPESWYGLRRVRPYHYTYNTYCKERWRDRELVDIFTSEFRDRPPEYYIKALEDGKVCLNGKPAGPNTIVKNGQVISHTLHRHEPPVTGNEIGIIHEDDDLLVIDKPAGVPVHSTGRYHFNSIIEILRSKYGQQFTPRPCNRLDRLTSGVMFIGKTIQGASMMTEKLKARALQKEYVARVKGKFPDGVIICDQPIMSVSPKLGLNRVRATGKEAKTKFRRLAYYPPTPPVAETRAEDDGARPATPPPSYLNESEGYSIVHCLPLTGRTHQIRVHLQFLGHPISNDPIYSNRRVFGPELGRNEATAEHDDEIIDRLMKMGRTELPETVTYRTHLTTAPLVPPGTDSSVVEAIMSREHEAAVEAYHKRKGEKLSGEICDVCGTELYTDPGVHELGIFLHAVAYSDHDGAWKYRSKMPSWGLPPAGLDGPREAPDWEPVPEDEEIVIGHGTIPDIDGEDSVPALVQGVGLVDISSARQAQEQGASAAAAAAAAANGV
ncbi:pseudouridine synthase [Aspergillus rambellii]|uniref:Pseudouridine synthase n=1 Tax=Aspergillus rambellii TaxID=308745 RepID=A0A0F8W3I5_9EURO|nr:pseudouridine synthase [Aspergillus rambellii]